MEYSEIKLNISNDRIREYKLFEGIKIYSDTFISDDKKTLINKRIYITKNKNYVYYERTDVNWNYWNNKDKYDLSFDTDSIKHNIVFEVSKDLTLFSRYLGEEIIRKIMQKEENGEIVEKLDI
ncbi:EXLDI protein [Lachnoanaerobaculum sp. Marseille-Q4761]|uniref:EXLDI protein n=1 Tax=Lachnoanaerobaculum sp. Marseille-Q4761 TaxID=2819511 RepID=UPI001AA1CC22|nr:EXLDI protein [Lachnoanaerobaculum sp. Marseille-Q4761]MBO1869976.1 EXLDI protein [Lachnoanaerobaculum sp. Marseille-Q4761]